MTTANIPRLKGCEDIDREARVSICMCKTLLQADAGHMKKMGWVLSHRLKVGGYLPWSDKL